MSSCTTFRVYGIPEEDEWSIRLAFFVFGNRVQASKWYGGHAETPAKIGGSVVDDDWGMCIAAVVIFLCYRVLRWADRKWVDGKCFQDQSNMTWITVLSSPTGLDFHTEAGF